MATRVTRSTRANPTPDEGISRSRSQSPARTPRGRKPAATATTPSIQTASESKPVTVLKPTSASSPINVKEANETPTQAATAEKSSSQMGKIFGFGFLAVVTIAAAYYFGHSTGLQQGLSSASKINVTEVYQNTNATCKALVEETTKNLNSAQSSTLEGLFKETNKTCKALVDATAAKLNNVASQLSANITGCQDALEAAKTRFQTTCMPLVSTVSQFVECVTKGGKEKIADLYRHTGKIAAQLGSGTASKEITEAYKEAVTKAKSSIK